MVSDPGRIRTCDRLIRSQMLYPLSYGTIFLLSIACHIRISGIFPLHGLFPVRKTLQRRIIPMAANLLSTSFCLSCVLSAYVAYHWSFLHRNESVVYFSKHRHKTLANCYLEVRCSLPARPPDLGDLKAWRAGRYPLSYGTKK